MDKQTSSNKPPRQSIFSKPNFFKTNQILKTKGLSPKFKKSSLPEKNIKFTQHKGGS